jgi:hypothetical protein
MPDDGCQSLLGMHIGVTESEARRAEPVLDRRFLFHKTRDPSPIASLARPPTFVVTPRARRASHAWIDHAPAVEHWWRMRNWSVATASKLLRPPIHHGGRSTNSR